MTLKQHMQACLGLCVILLLGNPAQAANPELSSQLSPQLSLDVPQKVARGDAFIARAISATPVERITFRWRGKEHAVPARAEPIPPATSTVQQRFAAEILLAVPVDDNKGKTMTLEARTSTSRDMVTVTLYSKNRPVQKLSVDQKYVNPPADAVARIEADRQKVRAATAVFSTIQNWSLPLLRPVPGSVSSLYGLKRVFNGQPRSVHKGLDLRGAEGTPIAAAASGVVVLADNLYFSGNAVYLDHGLGVFTAYLHMSQSHVQVGQRVERGETIGLVGATGRVTGPHLHLTMLVQGVPVDPQPLMETTP